MIVPAAAWEPRTLMYIPVIYAGLNQLFFRCFWHKNLSARAYIKTDAYTFSGSRDYPCDDYRIIY